MLPRTIGINPVFYLCQMGNIMKTGAMMQEKNSGNTYKDRENHVLFLRKKRAGVLRPAVRFCPIAHWFWLSCNYLSVSRI